MRFIDTLFSPSLQLSLRVMSLDNTEMYTEGDIFHYLSHCLAAAQSTPEATKAISSALRGRQLQLLSNGAQIMVGKGKRISVCPQDPTCPAPKPPAVQPTPHLQLELLG